MKRTHLLSFSMLLWGILWAQVNKINAPIVKQNLTLNNAALKDKIKGD